MIKCLQCKNEIDDTWIGGGKSLFHYFTVHGIPPEHIEKMLNDYAKDRNHNQE